VVGLGAAVLGAALGVPGDVTSMGADLYLKSFSRDQEYEADLLGVRYLNRTGYDPYAQADFLAALEEHDQLQAVVAGNNGATRPPEFLSTHPRTLARVVKAVEAASQTGAPPAAPRRRDIYLDHIDGMIYGDDPAQGLVRGRTFSHPVMRFTYTVPQDFRLINSDKAVLARGPNKTAIILDSRKVRAGTEPGRYLIGTWAKQVSLQDVERITVNGMKAATGWARGRSSSGAVDVRLVAIQFEPTRMFRFQFITPTSQTRRFKEDLERTTYSFRRLTDAEAAALKPYRIRVVGVRQGDTAQSLARRMVMPDHKMLRFRVLNGLAEGENPRPGSRVKIVTE
jgi:predicted Zn-dependent protease